MTSILSIFATVALLSVNTAQAQDAACSSSAIGASVRGLVSGVDALAATTRGQRQLQRAGLMGPLVVNGPSLGSREANEVSTFYADHRSELALCRDVSGRVSRACRDILGDETRLLRRYRVSSSGTMSPSGEGHPPLSSPGARYALWVNAYRHAINAGHFVEAGILRRSIDSAARILGSDVTRLSNAYSRAQRASIDAGCEFNSDALANVVMGMGSVSSAVPPVEGINYSSDSRTLGNIEYGSTHSASPALRGTGGGASE